MNSVKTIMLLMICLLAIAGCQKKTEPAAPPTNDSNTAVSAQIEQTICPVMEGNPIDKNVFVEYQGKKVYFCCPACIKEFNKDPEKYLPKLPQFNK